MKIKKEQEETSIIINDRNLENLKFKFIRKGITIIIGENDVGKSNILDYIYYNNEEWDGIKEHVGEFKKTKSCYKMPLLFSSNFRVLCNEHQSSLKREEKGEKLVEYSYKIYYFDLKTSVEFLNKEMEEIIVPKVRSRNFNFYLFKKEEDEEDDTEKEKSNTLIVSETSKLRNTDEEFWEVDYGSDAKFTRNKEKEVIKYDGYNEYKGRHHPIENVGSGYLRHKKLKSLAKILSLNEKKPVERLALIDEPELFLHPSLIGDIANSIKELEKKGVTLIMTTHSPFFLSQFIHEKGVNLAIAKGEGGGLSKLLYFSEIIENAKRIIVEAWGRYCPCFKTEISEKENFYENKWKSLLNEVTLKIFFSKKILFVEGITEYIFFNSTSLRSKIPEFDGIEVIPIFSKFNYVFFSELVKRMGLKYRFLLDEDENLVKRAGPMLIFSRLLSQREKEEKKDKERNLKKEKPFQNCRHATKCTREKLHKRFWIRHSPNINLRTGLREVNIIHDEESDISWFPHNLEVFLNIDEKDPHI
ncbi:MAG: ATP-dependent endonuclease [Mycoplasmataceae bacterium RV_VA103A]|nr:MAG: ATP-dependent endonuclease [Mycoplasmataceae bacterium RV_VA103A]